MAIGADDHALGQGIAGVMGDPTLPWAIIEVAKSTTIIGLSGVAGMAVQ